MVKLASLTKSYDRPIGFSLVRHVVPLETLVHEQHGGAHNRRLPAPPNNPLRLPCNRVRTLCFK